MEDKKIYKHKHMLDRELLKRIPEETILREMLCNFLKDIPMDDLRKLFAINKIDPQNTKAQYFPNDRNWIKEMQQLNELRCVQFEAKIKI